MATAHTLIAYAVGLSALSAVQIVVRVFYSMKDTRTPVKIAVVSLIFTMAASLALMRPLSYIGLAAAGSLGAMLQLVLLLFAVRRRLGRIDGGAVWGSVIKNFIWALIMAAPVYFIAVTAVPWLKDDVMGLLIRVTAGLLGGLLVYFGLAWVFGAPELIALRNGMARRFRRG